MPSISVKELLSWKKKQLSKGGDYQSFALLLDSLGGVSNNDLNLLKINSKNNLYLKKNLEYLESIWDDHLLFRSLQYLCETTFGGI